MALSSNYYETFKTLQNEGVARPAPAPSPTYTQYPELTNTLQQPTSTTSTKTGATTGRLPTGTNFSLPPTGISGPTPQLPPPPQVTGGGTPAWDGGLGYPPPPNIEGDLYSRWANPQASPVGQAYQDLTLSWLQNPTRYTSDLALGTYDRLNNRLTEGYDIERQRIDEEMSNRGLYNSTIAGGRYGDVAVQQARAQADLAHQILEDQARTYSSDLSGALGAGLGYGNFASGEDQRNLGNYLNYGQQGFENQMQTAQYNQNQEALNTQLLMALLGAT